MYFELEGPNIDDCLPVDKFTVLNVPVTLFSGKLGFFLSIGGYRSLGPFMGVQEAMIGLAEYYAANVYRLTEQLDLIEKVCKEYPRRKIKL